MKKIKIKTRYKNYQVIIGESAITIAVNKIKKAGLHNNLFIVIDEKVFNLHEKYINDAFSKAGNKIYFYKLKPGEQSKSFDELTSVISSLLENNFGRDTLLIAIGGGVTGDLAGFAASVFMRGVQFVQVPTTLLACIDSAIGGKTGINFNNIKNTVGSFCQPEFVLIDTKFITSLPLEEINSGIGELIKYAFLTNEKFYNYTLRNFDKLNSPDKKILNNVIYESVLFKGTVIAKDEFEGGLRKILNFGHTFAHAFESYSKYSLKHGEAVSLGIISALFLSHRKGFLSRSKLNQYLELPLKMKYTSEFEIQDYDSVIRFMHGDKKNRDGELRFILLKDIGKIITDVSAEESEIIYAMKMTETILQKNKSALLV